VLDLTDEQGFYCGQLLGSLGADVIKIERPGGDPARLIPPFLHGERNIENGLYWLSFNTNKRSITLNLETPEGKDVFRKLLKISDVVVESLPPGRMAALGFSYDELDRVNPKIILTSITPFGQEGPRSTWKGSDLVCWAMGGLLAQTGDPDRPPVRTSHINFAYLMAGADAAWGTAIALYWRNKSGRGQHVTVSIQQSVAKTNFMAHEVFEVTGKEQKRASSFYRVERSDVKLKSVWEAKDGYVAFLIFGGHWGATHDNPRLVKWIDEEGMADDYLRSIDWAKLSWRRTPLDEVARIHGYVERFFKSKTKAELLEGAIKRRIAIQPVNTPGDILKHPQLEARDYWQDLPLPDGTMVKYPSRFCLPSYSPCKQWRPAPKVGEHNLEIYCGLLGLSTGEVKSLHDKGVI
ncbi:MAG: CoA transferase, partial [Dehalococcoidia bacterium]|nr:CoA transferase [Dehalococcoidia bacterium]